MRFAQKWYLYIEAISRKYLALLVRLAKKCKETKKICPQKVRHFRGAYQSLSVGTAPFIYLRFDRGVINPSLQRNRRSCNYISS